MADSLFLRDLTGYRVIVPAFGESIQELAARELGDAAAWPLIVWVNGLVPPYLTDNPALVADGVVLAGTSLVVPSEALAAAVDADPLGTDVALVDGRLDVSGGDVALVSGLENLRQALRHRVLVARGSLLFHLDYGSFVPVILGGRLVPQALRLAEFYARSSLLADPRVTEVPSCIASGSGDVASVRASVLVATGELVDVEV